MASRRITDDELRALCEQELWSAAGASGDLAAARSKAMDRYLGEPRGDEVEGRSQIRTRETLETVEWLMPSLMRIFADSDNICLFEAVGPEDEEAAKQETDAVEHVFWRKNRGFHNLYSFIKDGLIQKTGILKVWWDDTPDETREEYESLSEWELAQLLGDQYVDIDVVDSSINDDGTYNVTIITRKSDGCLHIEPCPPEEFGVDRDARSIYPEDAQFVYHRTRKTKAELVEAGFPRKKVEALPAANDTLTEERNARRHLSDEQDREVSDHWSMERVWITECYIRVDRDDDGIAELLKVTLAGADSAYATGSTVLDVEEVDRQPFVVWSPVLLTHKFYGLSAEDLVADIESIMTALTRSVLDNTYLSNNGRTHVNERVNLDDLLTSRPGGVVRSRGEHPVGENLMQLQAPPIPPQTFELIEHLQDSRQRRIGVGDEVGALDSNALSKVNTGVAAMAYDAARAKIELMARVCAEIGLRPLFLRMHELLRKNNGKQTVMRLAGEWVPVNPQQWRERTDMTVTVGIGRASRERRMMAHERILELQSGVIERGGMGSVILPQHLYQSAADYTDAWGLDPSKYWQNPAELPPPEPQGPDPQMEIAMGQLMVANKQVDVSAWEAQSKERIAMAQLQQKQEEAILRNQLTAMQADLKALQDERSTAVNSAKVELDAQIKSQEQQIRMAEARLEDHQKAADREADILRTLIQTGGALTQAQMKQTGIEGESPIDGIRNDQKALGEGLTKTISEAFAQARKEAAEAEARAAQTMAELRAELAGPKEFERDASGLVVTVGGKPVRRGPDGLIQGIG